ncbi:MAG: Gfo/Idh/MocA family oxidoreductase [Subtercola sp.]|nr:Gfo/Idh/MocA family oxidoreductase [Subtercola sp.]
MSPSVIRVGVLGLGAVAQAVHLPLLARRPELFEISAVADLAPDLTERIADRFGVPHGRRFSSLDEMLDAGGLDAVMIFSRGSHAGAVADCFERGLPVFCEKPLAYTLAEVDELLTHFPPATSPMLLLGYMKQYDPAVEAAAEALRDVDDVRSVEATVLHPTGASQLEFAHVVGPAAALPADVVAQADADEARLWQSAVGDADESLWRAYRGALVSSLAHDLSVFRSLDVNITDIEFADLWRQSSRTAVRDAGRDRRSFGEHPPSISAIGTLAAGGRFSLAWHYLPDFPAYRETVRVVHGKGTVELVFPSPYLMHAPTELTVTSADGNAERRVVRRSIVEAFETQLEAFYRMVHDGEQPRSGLAEGRADILLCQQIVARFAGRTGAAVGGEVGALIAAMS